MSMLSNLKTMLNNVVKNGTDLFQKVLQTHKEELESVPINKSIAQGDVEKLNITVNNIPNTVQNTETPKIDNVELNIQSPSITPEKIENKQTTFKP